MHLTRRQFITTVIAATAVAPFAAHAQSPVRVACVGDSITNFAIEPLSADAAYPVQLQQILGSGFQVENYGISGATMLKSGDKPYWELQAFNDAIQLQPDIVTIKLGSNDSKPQNWNAAEYEADYRAMIETFLSLSAKPTILPLRPVPAFGDGFGISNAVILNEILPILDKLAAEFRLRVVDLYNVMRTHGDLFPDGIHPNAEGCTLIAEYLAPIIRQTATKHAAE